MEWVAQDEIHVFVSMPDRFMDDVLRKTYVHPVIDLFNEGRIKKVVFMARGQAINAAVRVALLVEDIMGVMHKTITIGSQPVERTQSSADPEKKDARRQTRLLSSMEIAMIPF